MAKRSRKHAHDMVSDIPPAVASLWHEGWYARAKPCPSPNFEARPANTVIDLIVIHCISLPPQEYKGAFIEDFFGNCLDWNAHPFFTELRGLKVSAHFLIRRNGQLLQFVSCNARAWHAGASRFQGRDNCNNFSIGIELEGFPGDVFAQTQYQTLKTLLAALKQNYPVAFITGHSDIAPERKQDPGAGFDWSELDQTQWPHASASV